MITYVWRLIKQLHAIVCSVFLNLWLTLNSKHKLLKALSLKAKAHGTFELKVGVPRRCHGAL